MRGKHIYVELDIATDMESLWKHTQDPQLHQQWDLRFTDIQYLPQEDPANPQRFHYRTRIGFGLDISGTGESRSARSLDTGGAISTLSFQSEQPISLIRRGGGYWRYKPGEQGVNFSTKFNYSTRFGALGRLLDAWLFRPMFGYATAWSFDMLRIWLERGIAPAVTIQRAVIHYASVLTLSLLWFYQGLVPKLMTPAGGELDLLRATNIFPPAAEHNILLLLGLSEMGCALVILWGHRLKSLYVIQSILLIALAILAIAASPNLPTSPFNPITLTVPMLTLALIASLTTTDLPSAGRCKRRQPSENEKERRGSIWLPYTSRR
ncbi:DoxX-like family protein [Paenibacillus sp. strain BS8-2]